MGYDSHRFGPGRRLVLGGVEIPHDMGLIGHSDADALAHAVIDALLGAAGLGDIGRMFPDSDPRWKDADSMAMLAAVVGMVLEAGYEVSNVDCVVVAERPRIASHVEDMRRAFGRAGIPPRAVSIKGKTNERMGFTGRGEGIAAMAVCLLSPKSPDFLDPEPKKLVAS
jgi:2-C-methyl-D-erythritol 2,4-cyclodiphosphate synthase